MSSQKTWKAWTDSELEILQKHMGRRLPNGTLQKIADQLGRSKSAVSVRLSHLRDEAHDAYLKNRTTSEVMRNVEKVIIRPSSVPRSGSAIYQQVAQVMINRLNTTGHPTTRINVPGKQVQFTYSNGDSNVHVKVKPGSSHYTMIEMSNRTYEKFQVSGADAALKAIRVFDALDVNDKSVKTITIE